MKYPIANGINCEKSFVKHRKFLTALTTNIEPQTFAQAIKDERWLEEMQQEIKVLETNGTWVF